MFEYSDESIEEIETDFPKLRDGRYRIASSQDKKYNCIAFAAGDINRYWQNLGHPMKGYFWPPGLTDDETIDGWMRAFRLLNYEVTNTADPEIGFEKIAIYGTQEGTALHVAIRKDSGPWMSKLGKGHDIEHETLDILECGIQHKSDQEHSPCYGRAIIFMRRKRHQVMH